MTAPRKSGGVHLRHAGRKPRDDEIDAFGLTHPGKIRRSNQDPSR